MSTKNKDGLSDPCTHVQGRGWFGRAAGSPLSPKLTPIFADGLRYRYYAVGTDGRGREVRLCYSTKRNLPGYYMAWREVWSADGSARRDKLMAHRIKSRLISRQRKKAEQVRERPYTRKGTNRRNDARRVPRQR